ncbi:MAG: hypothetical protein ACT4P8_11335, partial [Betaproteobacteria bacterium]
WRISARFPAWALLVAFVASPALAASAGDRAPVATPVRLANLGIDIWPDYDRRAALVIVKAELAADVPLPAAMSIRIPDSSGGPSAVAFADAGQTGLFDLPHERSSGEGYITLRFTAPQRYVHIEFYDPIVTNDVRHTYTYVWPGDLAADRVSVRLQEPAGASAISVEPDLGTGSDGPDGLLYRTRALGPLEAGARLPIEVRYTKRDARTTTAIMGLNAAAPAPSGPEYPAWAFGLVSLTLVSVAAVAISLWWHRRTRLSASPKQGGGRYCTRCGAAMASGDRYCAACGARARG